MERLARGLVTAATIFYTIPVAAWLLFRFWKGEAWPMVGLLNAAGLLWFAPLLVLLPVALVVRARQASVMAGGIALVALAFYGGEFVPAVGARAPDETPQLRVLSFNALVSNTAFAEIEAMVRAEQPDVIAIQELSHEMAAEITARLGAEYPYSALYPWGDPRGIGLWSRFPLTDQGAQEFELWEGWLHSVVLDVGGRPVTLLNVHLWPIGVLDRAQFARALSRQHAQARALRDLAAATPGPVIVVGDFNASPTNETYAIVDEALDDAWRAVGFGPGFSWPAPGSVSRRVRPFLRIDYLWTRGPIRPLSFRPLAPTGSDHLPLLGEFVLTEGAP